MVMKGMEIQPTPVDTHGFRQVHHVVEQTCQDSEELFHDLQYFNPFTAEMLTDFYRTVHTVKARIYRPDTRPNKIGYQGIPGSFSEEAALKYMDENSLLDVETVPCVSSQGVLDQLATFKIDRGILAMENARGGVVHESIHALAGARCRVSHMFHIQVNQCLLVKQGMGLDHRWAPRPFRKLFLVISYLESDTSVWNPVGTVLHSRRTASVKTG